VVDDVGGSAAVAAAPPVTREHEYYI
jgi:hypothetical protein